jgi:hypothetical protein
MAKNHEQKEPESEEQSKLAGREPSSRLSVYLSNGEAMLAAIDRDISGEYPTIAAIELKPLLVRAMELARKHAANTYELENDELKSLTAEFKELHNDIQKRFTRWKKESEIRLLDALSDERGGTSGTIITPDNWQENPQ